MTMQRVRGGGDGGRAPPREGSSALALSACPFAAAECAASLGTLQKQQLEGTSLSLWLPVLAAGNAVLGCGNAPSAALQAAVGALDAACSTQALQRPLGQRRKGVEAENTMRTSPPAAIADADGCESGDATISPGFAAVVDVAVDLVMVARGRIRRQSACLLNFLERQHSGRLLYAGAAARVAAVLDRAIQVWHHR